LLPGSYNQTQVRRLRSLPPRWQWLSPQLTSPNLVPQSPSSLVLEGSKGPTPPPDPPSAGTVTNSDTPLPPARPPTLPAHSAPTPIHAALIDARTRPAPRWGTSRASPTAAPPHRFGAPTAMASIQPSTKNAPPALYLLLTLHLRPPLETTWTKRKTVHPVPLRLPRPHLSAAPQ